MVFCGTCGLSFTGVPFGFGFVTVEDSAGDCDSMTIKKEKKWVEGDGGSQDKGGLVGRSLEG